LPSLFRLESDETFYIFCPLADDRGQFSMLIPSKIAADFPHMSSIGRPDDANYDFKPSLTKCTVLQQGFTTLPDKRVLPVTKVKLFPMTGRRHQLRVHMALAGHPILGDATYGQMDIGTTSYATTATSEEPPITSHRIDASSFSRMCLHAHSLALESLLGEADSNWEIKAPDPFPIDENDKFHLNEGF
jgi:hypothetical protein